MPFEGGGGAGLRVRRRCQAVACGIGGTGSLQARALRFVEKGVLRKRKEPHCWGSEGAMGFEEDFVLVMRSVSRDCIGSWQKRALARLCLSLWL